MVRVAILLAEWILVFFLVPQTLDIFCFEHLLAAFYRRLGKLLPLPQLAHGTGPVEFPLKALERSVDIFSFFYRYN